MYKLCSLITAFLFLSTMLYSNSIFGQISELEEKLKHDPQNKELLLKIGKYYHDLGGNLQNKKAVKKAELYLSKLLESQPENTVALVYYGSVLTMKARDSFSHGRK